MTAREARLHADALRGCLARRSTIQLADCRDASASALRGQRLAPLSNSPADSAMLRHMNLLITRFATGFLVWSLLSSTAGAAGSTCAVDARIRAAAALAGPLATMQRAVAENETGNPDLDAETAAAIVALKQQLPAFVDAHLTCTDNDARVMQRFEHALAEALHAAPAAGFANTGIIPQDALPRFSSGGQGEFLSVVAQIGIPCGSDALWLLYAPHEGGWRRVLQWTSAPYTRIDGAWEAFQHAVSPRDADGRWFAAVSHIRPWCSSSWSTVDYAVLRPGADADKPAVVLSGSDSLWWGGDDMGRLSVDASHAELRFRGASVDPGVHNREFIRRYDVSGTAPRRVAPVADSPRDFVDEWIVSNWSAARLWSHEASGTALERAHEQMQAARKHASFEFGDTMACVGGGVVQVELRDGDDASWFFRVAGRSDYRMVAVARQSDPQCGKALPATRE